MNKVLTRLLVTFNIFLYLVGEYIDRVGGILKATLDFPGRDEFFSSAVNISYSGHWL